MQSVTPGVKLAWRGELLGEGGEKKSKGWKKWVERVKGHWVGTFTRPKPDPT